MTLCTSAIDSNAENAGKTAFVYLLAALFCVFFGAVYEVFSHQVYSFFMIYAFVFPLAGGTLPFCILHLKRAAKYPSATARSLYHSGIATLTVGSIIRGILDIYGTTNALARLYWGVGIVLLLAAAAVYLVQICLPDKKT